MITVLAVYASQATYSASTAMISSTDFCQVISAFKPCIYDYTLILALNLSNVYVLS